MTRQPAKRSLGLTMVVGTQIPMVIVVEVMVVEAMAVEVMVVEVMVVEDIL